ncbi:hypothetical protein A3F02_02110 [Candidatus Curtissbacteria bacterium RIFCSPHIGHO2_12_FULL_38_9b]|uniref:Uncharacterized protein n=2 Tax=Candidatus Curtissiibacteriota TaxID=1752717 RepID=A0A1F5GYX6_9BACT|nr:MAG: hypothetical protein A3A48_01400 [Candidatus Curtissbacteria bacterium RIFCSPLOWO2_01_FULL_37_9]OGD97122.1 MAG: hypothetical protein A3F02_02110 [Candidatus Curtissbacteria bacterium RIFCSPHIGHO2_12_FULL_38_9b]
MNKEQQLIGGANSVFKIEKAILRKIPLNYEIIGKENLNKIRQLLIEGSTVVAVLDHRSYADTASGGIIHLRKISTIFLKMQYL